MLAEAFSMMRTNRKATNEVLPEDCQTTTSKRAVGPDGRGVTGDRPWDECEGVQVSVVRRLSRIVAPCLGHLLSLSLKNVKICRTDNMSGTTDVSPLALDWRSLYKFILESANADLIEKQEA
jgi:hypothetical protein